MKIFYQYLFICCVALVSIPNLLAQFPTGNTNFPNSNGNFPSNNGFPSTPNARSGNQNGQSNANGVGIDDSTKTIYGPKSVKYFFEQEIFNNQRNIYNPDTILTGTHNYNFIAQNGFLWRDLGNMGTPMQRLFYTPPTTIGSLSGFESYSPYLYNPETIRYYNTKSPFSHLYFVTGGNGQNILRVDFARNVDSLFNVGFNLQRTTSFKQFGFNTRLGSEDFLTENWNSVLHANYRSPNGKYLVLGHWNHVDISTSEQGGMVSPDGITPEESLARDNNNPLLTGASGSEVRNDLHFYHQYAMKQGFQLYQVIDLQFRSYGFQDSKFGSDSAFFYGMLGRYRRTPTDTAFLKVNYQNIENKIGIKGFYRGFNYRLHLRTRFLSFTNIEKQPTVSTNLDLFPYTKRDWPIFTASSAQKTAVEQYVGLWLNQYLKDSTKVFLDFEYLLGSDYRFRLEFHTKKYVAGIYRTFYSPTLLQELAVGNFFRWQNKFEYNTLSDQIYASASQKFGKLTLSVNADLTRAAHLMYFDTLARPTQADESQIFYKLGLSWNWERGRWKSSGMGYFTTSSGADIIRFPKIWANGRLSYDFKFAKVLYIQAGVELTYTSAYKADAYMPATMQYHLQDDYTTKSYLVADVFANLRINRTRLFFKMSHVNQGYNGGGYFVRPYYPLVGRTFGFGVNWLLFD